MSSVLCCDLKKSSLHQWKLICILFISIVVSLPINAGAQGSKQDRIIDSKIQAEIIDSLTQSLNETYVFPDVAKEMEKYLRQKYDEGKYKDLTSLTEFAQKLAEDLLEISKDKHIRVSFISDEMLAGFESDTLTDEEKKRELEENRRDNFCFREIKILEGNVGYIDFRCFSDPVDAGATAVAAMNFLAYADAIIFDLRQNGGGNNYMAQLISSYLFHEPVQLNSIYSRKSDSIEQFWTQAHVRGPRLSNVDIYALTSSSTFSAAEGFIYDLKNLKRGVIIGETTRGGAHPIEFKFFHNLNLGMIIPFARAINPISGTNWEGTGITPDIEVPQEKALDVAHLQALEKLLEKAKDPDREAELKWAIDGKKILLNPVTIEKGKLRVYVGQYGPRKIWMEEGKLYYQRENRPKYKLIPMGDHWFMLEGLDYFRIQFVMDKKGKATELIGHYSEGPTDSHKRNK